MDEHNGFLRVATTTGNVWDGSSKNSIYILDSSWGTGLILLHFKKVDPFFVVDKAFLFSREKHTLVIPVTVYKIDNETKERLNGYTGSIYGKHVFQGVYVYNVDLDNGIV
ncbi:MAG: beta-propeller domain-containing protein [Thermoplasmata archaeon]|nr:beta-propeller domain-containing protein [Thermoplasmata archaeon]